MAHGETVVGGSQNYCDVEKNAGLVLKLFTAYCGISKMADRLSTALEIYPENMLVSFNPNWPVTEVKKLLHSLKENDQDWCEVFFEYLIYVMSKKN